MQAIISHPRMRGFSLIELMVAIAISLLLLMGVVALFVSSRASYETTERLSRIQENGRFALDQFATDVRSAGFQGCARSLTMGTRPQDFRISTVINEIAPDPDMRWNFVEPARGFNATGAAWPTTLTDSLDPDPNIAGDILVLRIPRREVKSIQLTTRQVSPTDPLTVGTINPMPLQAGDTAVISDCEARAFFQVTGYNSGTGQIAHAVAAATAPTGPAAVATPGNDAASLDHPFMAGAEILPIVTMIYYLAPSADQPPAPQPVRMSLWRKTGGVNRSDEIAEGIDRLEIQYGIDNSSPRDGTADTYVTADAVTDWGSVLTLQVALLARAPENSGTDLDNQTYTLFATPTLVTAGPFNDRGQRKVFTATIAVRNQIID
jgi:type IV pilus assembly protein PilW